MSEKKLELVFLCDRSGSMGGLESDTIGGYNAMLQKQKAQPGCVRVTTVLFDDQYELLHDRLEIQAVAPIQKMALAGMGRPLNSVACESSRLNLARRRAPIAGMKTATKGIHQEPVHTCRMLYRRSEGATPKLTRSASESSSLPRGEGAWSHRAAAPSKKSKTAARPTSIQASWRPLMSVPNTWPIVRSNEKAQMQARQPEMRLQRVRVLGTAVMIFRRNSEAIFN